MLRFVVGKTRLHFETQQRRDHASLRLVQMITETIITQWRREKKVKAMSTTTTTVTLLHFTPYLL
jgi:hypothetical protein